MHSNDNEFDFRKLEYEIDREKHYNMDRLFKYN